MVKAMCFGFDCSRNNCTSCFIVLLTAVLGLSQVKVAHVGSSVMFVCDATDVNLSWEFSSSSYPSGSRTLYEHPNISDRFMWRHSVSANILSINNVQLCDANFRLMWRCR